MIERRRLRAGVEVFRDSDGDYYTNGPDGRKWWVPDWATEPIPEEEATGEVERQAAHIRGQMDAAKSGLRDIDEAYRLGGVPYLVQALRVRAMEAEQRDRDKDRAMADLLARVEALEERDIEHSDKIGQLMSKVGLTRSVQTVRNPAPAAADGPSAEEVLAWLSAAAAEAEHPMIDHAIRLIRAGQEEERPVLTAEMVEKACRAMYPKDDPSTVPWGARWPTNSTADTRNRMGRALLATGAFWEAPDAT